MAEMQEKGPDTAGRGGAGEITNFSSSLQQQKHPLEALKSASEQFQDFVYIVSHDLGNPMFSIQAFGTELNRNCERLRELLDGTQVEKAVKDEALAIIDKDMAEALNYIQKSVEEMKRLLAGLKRVSRVGSASVHIEPLDMNELISSLLDSVKAHIERAGAKITVDELPRCLGDAILVKQVFSNLLCNSLKFLDRNRPGIIHMRGWAKNGWSVYVVEDNGVGIEPRHQKKIFEVFWRLDSSGTTEGEGVGLTIVRRIIDRHKGKIWLESEVGKGSTFYVSLPSVPRIMYTP
jgi:signal transduction histidine kinase